MKKKLLFSSGALTLFFIICNLEKTNAQAWEIGSNNVPGDATLGTVNTNALDFITKDTTRLHINFNGRISIGTNATGRAQFTLNGTVGNTMAIFGNDLHGISLINDEPAIGFNNYYNGGWKLLDNGYSGFVSLSSTTGNMQFATSRTGTKNSLVAPTVRVTILQNGNVGIGSDNPGSLLEVKGGDETLGGNLYFTSGTQSIQFANPGTAPQAMMNMFPSGTQNPDRMVIAHSPSYQDWGLRYRDTTDQFDFIGAGGSRLSI